VRRVASHGERSAEVETDRDGIYFVPADKPEVSRGRNEFEPRVGYSCELLTCFYVLDIGNYRTDSVNEPKRTPASNRANDAFFPAVVRPFVKRLLRHDGLVAVYL
jgi:hypothetical protein